MPTAGPPPSTGRPPASDGPPPWVRPAERIGVALVVVAGAVLRFVAGSPLWLDEAQTVNVARLPLGEIPGALGRDGLPPLFYVLLHGWTAAFGEGDVAVRALAGVFALAALPVAYVAGRRLGGVRVGALAVVVLAANPFAIRYATETRMYSLAMLLTLVGVVAVGAALDDPRLPRLAGVAAVTALLLYTHYWALWLVGAAVLVLAVVAVRERSADRGRAAARTLAAGAVGGLAFLPWLPTFLDQAAHTATPWAPPSRPSQVVATALVELGGSDLAEGVFLGGTLLALCMVLGLFGRARPPWGITLDLRTVPPARGVAAVAAGTLVLGGLAGVVSGSAFVGRYAAVAVPLLLLVAAVGLSRLPDARLVLAAAGVVALLGLGLAAKESRVDRTQAGEIAAAIVAGDPDGGPVGERPVVVYCPDQLGPAVDRLLPEGAFDQVIFPELDAAVVDAPGRIDWYDYADRQASIPPPAVAEALVDRAGPTNAIWVVFNPTYRTPGERCTALVDALGTHRVGRPVVAAAGDTYFEHANLVLFRPAAG